jgi:hypothetical protein
MEDAAYRIDEYQEVASELDIAASPTGGDRDDWRRNAKFVQLDLIDNCHEHVTNCHKMSLIATPHTETNCEINWNLTCAVLALNWTWIHRL